MQLHTPPSEFRTPLIGIDSDGCVFDTMEVKQCVHFHPLILRHWDLWAIEAALRAVAEYVNLRSPWRGSNRFVALLKTFELLPGHPGTAGVVLPPTGSLRDWIDSGEGLDNTSLASRANRLDDAELRRIHAWSLAVNEDIQAHMAPVPPFPGARETLARLAAVAETLVVSLTPRDALEQEWTHHGLRAYAHAIAGQEAGSKSQQLRQVLALRPRSPDHVLLIGDAPGDLAAARDTGACFFPILPGDEIQSWHVLSEEGIDRFLEGRYRGAFEEGQIQAFSETLNHPPPW